MNNAPNNVDQFLPHGEMLRGFVEQSFVAKSDIRTLLRQRGIFSCSNEKKDTVPILASVVLSPTEFDRLRECHNTREDNPKTVTQVVAWDSPRPLIESVPDEFDISKIADCEYANYEINGQPQFVPINNDPNHVRLDFQIERTDLSKNWAEARHIFDGSIELKRIVDGKSVRMVITHTANETKQVAQKTSAALVSHFKKSGEIPTGKEVERICFSRFSNAKRIAFLLDLTSGISSSRLRFKDTVDLEVSPDTAKGTLPSEMKWMETGIEHMKLRGRSLHRTFFLEKKDCHDFAQLYRVDSSFDFDVKGLKGANVISFSFPEFGKPHAGDPELEITVKSISFEETPIGSQKNEVKTLLMEELREHSIATYKKHSDQA